MFNDKVVCEKKWREGIVDVLEAISTVMGLCIDFQLGK